mgnify:CR=1 FL=1
MELRPIPARGWADWYTQELCASFPACECKPLEAIRALAAEGRYELLGLYEWGGPAGLRHPVEHSGVAGLCASGLSWG